MPTPFATQREPAGFQGTPAVLQNNGGTAAGRVGVAVPLSLRWRTWPLAVSCLVSTGCVPSASSYLPETMTITTSLKSDRRGGGWECESVGASFTWCFRPTGDDAVFTTDPKPSNPCRP